ncbi:MAG TPA: hypothetical protein VGD06_10345 [Acidobacteriota bacterium]
MKPPDAEQPNNAGAPQQPTRMPIFTALLGYLSLRLLYSDVTGDGFVDSWATSLGSDAFLAILKLATVGVGIAAAVGLWSAKRWAFWSYLAWVPCYIGVALVSDSRVESVVWKLAVGVAPVVILTGLGAVYLYKRMA